VTVVAARVLGQPGRRVDAERELLDHLGHEQREDAERVGHGGATLVGRHPAGQVEVGKQRAARADQGTDRDRQRRLVVSGELIERPASGQPGGRSGQGVRRTHHV
jgi:hypothetical protein